MGAVSLDRVLGDEQLSSDLAIAESAGDQVQDLELARGDAEALLLRCVRGEGGTLFHARARNRDEDFPHDDPLASAGYAQPEPDAKAREQGGNKRAIHLD